MKLKDMFEGKLFILLLIGLVVSASLFAVSSVAVNGGISTFNLTKPAVVDINVLSSPLIVSAVDFNSYYNASSNRWEYVKVTVENTGSTDLVGEIECILYDADGNVVASGSLIQSPINAGSTVNVEVPLTWESDKTVEDVADGRIVVSAI